jgi:hypothetical protein
MKNIKYLFVTLLLSITIFLSQSCEDNSHEGCGETNISHFNDDNSHNNGKDCMTCHTDGGEGEGCFVISGSVYDSMKTSALPNVTLKLYTQVNGTGQLKYTVQGDKNGNFFTTDNINYGGLFPTITGSSGEIHYMSTALTKGNCNSCHGVSTDKLWTR